MYDSLEFRAHGQQRKLSKEVYSLYLPDRDVWKQLPNMIRSVWKALVCCNSSNIYVLGGINKKDNMVSYAQVSLLISRSLFIAKSMYIYIYIVHKYTYK